MGINLRANPDGTADFVSSDNSKVPLRMSDRRGAFNNFKQFKQFFDDFEGDVLDARWNGTAGGNAPAAAPAINVQDGGVVRLVSGDATGAFSDEGSCLARELNWLPSSGGLYMAARVKLVSTVATVAVNIGFTDTKAIEEPITLSGTTLTTNASDAAVFVYDTAASNDAFHCQGVKANTDTALLNTNIVPVADTWVELEVAIDSSGNATFFIDGTQVAVVANAVTASVALTPVFTIAPRTTASRSMDVDYVFIAGTRA